MHAIRVVAAVVSVSLATAAFGQTDLKYQKPPAPIQALLDAPTTPIAHLSPDRTTLLIAQPASYPTIADVAQPRFRLAGLRFNPQISGPSRAVYTVRLALQPVSGQHLDGAEKPIAGLPAKLRAVYSAWSPDSRHVAFVQRTDATAAAAERAPTAEKGTAAASSGLELWVIDVASARAHRVGTVHVNAVLGDPCHWMPDSAGLLCVTVPASRGPAPKPSEVPAGPNVEQNLGRVTPARTYEDMLKTPSDAAIFEYYATAQLAQVSLSGAVHPVAAKGMITMAEPSPSGRYALVSEIHRPFSYTLPAHMYPLKTSVVDLRTGTTKVLFDRPMVDNLPIAFDAVAAGPRDYRWRSDVPATVVFAEAGDGGDPNVKVDVHDRVLMLPAPFTAPPVVLAELPMRFRGLDWGNDHLAVLTEARWRDRRTALLALDPSAPGSKPTTLYEGSSQDRYHSPGRPMLAMNAAGFEVLQFTPDGNAIYFESPGATPHGEQPFAATMPVHGGEETILFRSADPYFADPMGLLKDGRVLVRRESVTESPNYFAVSDTPQATDYRQLTQFANPYAGLKLPTKQMVHYKRADGVELTANLWLPAGYDKSQGPLPTLMEAYPTEYKSRATAGQVTGSPNRFPRISAFSPVPFAMVGYAVLENASIPIVGEGNQQPNDTYVEQLVAGAKAAIDYGASLGVVDPNRVAVMGHSYGAFMTANLLAHSNMFRAGIARSGAYNRTLTPYGFQAEERTYWEAPEVYYKMSPFSYADKIKTPILLIHGEADDNQGTFPEQSERFYEALKGQGATVRLVWLPLEAHGYEARESLQHMLWEMDRWLDTYVKPETSPASNTATAAK
jgi:dipeptidyl aminopeptidase/acylaminoacyl peptidase